MVDGYIAAAACLDASSSYSYINISTEPVYNSFPGSPVSYTAFLTCLSIVNKSMISEAMLGSEFTKGTSATGSYAGGRRSPFVCSLTIKFWASLFPLTSFFVS